MPLGGERLRTKCEWDEAKAASNLAKHGVSFEEAETVSDDPNTAYAPDAVYPGDEERGIAIGYTLENRLLFIVYTSRGEVPRIISARRATAQERRRHERNSKYYNRN